MQIRNLSARKHAPIVIALDGASGAELWKHAQNSQGAAPNLWRGAVVAAAVAEDVRPEESEVVRVLRPIEEALHQTGTLPGVGVGEELAQRVGCAPITIRKLEGDKMRPSKQLAESLSRSLGIPPSQRENLYNSHEQLD